MLSIPTLDRQSKVIAKPLSFSEQAQQLHRKCDRIITSIQIQRELLGDAINEADESKQNYISNKLDKLYEEYRANFFKLMQPIIEKMEE
jgi:GTP-sensing pleiotropic transcriptional regulator CodY